MIVLSSSALCGIVGVGGTSQRLGDNVTRALCGSLTRGFIVMTMNSVIYVLMLRWILQYLAEI